LDEGLLNDALAFLQRQLYVLGPGRHLDAQHQAHLYKSLQALVHDDRLRRQLLALQAPWNNAPAERLIRESIGAATDERITPALARRAVLSALFTALRQTVGSCFATAPAIMVQAQQPWRFLRDLEELLNTGQLSRTFGGVQYTVPLCKSWGLGDLL